MQAFTYSIRQISTGLWYYGVRKSTVFDLGIVYFSSSKLVKRLILENGLSDFEFKVRKIFNSYEDGRRHETRFLQRVKAVANKKLLNQAISSPCVPKKDPVSEANRRQKISQHQEALWANDDYKKSHPFNNVSIFEQSARGRKGALARAEKYKTGELTSKRKPLVYKEVTIIKNGVQKQVKSNQVPAYRKYGWEKI